MKVWEVWQGPTLICSAQLQLSKKQAENKVANERRLGWRMRIRRVTISARTAHATGSTTHAVTKSAS